MNLFDPLFSFYTSLIFIFFTCILLRTKYIMLKAKASSIAQGSSPSSSNKNHDDGQVVTINKRENDWSDLPQEIVRLIMEKWCRSDYRYGFARLMRYDSMLICKSWQIPDLLDISNRTGMDLFPWLMCYNWGDIRRNDWKEPDRLLCKLIDPCMQKHYTIEVKNTVKKRKLKKVRKVFVGAEALASSCGWVLFLTKRPSSTNNYLYIFHLFLYNPFTNETIEMPVLPVHYNFIHLYNHTSYNITFSVSPSSPECVVFVLLNDYASLEIRTCHPGDKTWMKFKCETRRDFLMPVVCAGGFFYCAFPNDGVLGVFDVKLQEFKLLLDQDSDETHRGSGNLLVSSSTGDILMADFDYKIYWRFDISEKQWVEVKDENVTFVNNLYSWRQKSYTVPALGKTKGLASNVYSLDSYYGDKLPQCYSDCITGEDEHVLNKIWVEPPLSGLWTAKDLLQFYKSFN